LLFSLYIPPPPHTSPLSLHDALPISRASSPSVKGAFRVESNSHPSNRNRSTIRNIFCERPNKPSLTTLKAPPLTLFVSTRDKFRSEEHTSELQSRLDLVCRLLLEKKK